MSSQDLPFIPPFPMSGIKRSRSYLEEQSSDNEESFNDNGNKKNRTGASPQHLSHEDVGSADIEENTDDEEQSESDESESEAAESDGEPQHATTELEKILKSMQNPLEEIDCDVSAEDLSKIIKTINANADDPHSFEQSYKDSNMCYAITAAANKKILEGIVASVLKRITSAVPEDEQVAAVLSVFRGPSAEAEGRKLLAAVFEQVDNQDEIHDTADFKVHAEPYVVDIIMKWDHDKKRKGLKKFLKIKSEHR